MMLERHGDVARIPSDDDVADLLPDRDAVERSVCLDEAPMRLRGELGADAGDGLVAHVDPRGQLVQRRREVRSVEDQQRAEHLTPRGPALRRRADGDVAGPELEAVPASTVREERPVAHDDKRWHAGWTLSTRDGSEGPGISGRAALPTPSSTPGHG